MSFIASNSMLLAQKSLDFLWQKQKVTMDNIANAETPGFKGKYVTFEEELSKQLSSMKNGSKSRMRKEILDSKIQIHTTNNESNRLDGNNVNSAVESMELAKSAIQYNYIIKALNDDFTRLRTVIKGQ